MEDEIGPASQEFIARLWQEKWGLPNVSVRRQYMPTDVGGLAWRAADSNEIWLVTWAVDGARAEIVSVQAMEPGRRIGSSVFIWTRWIAFGRRNRRYRSSATTASPYGICGSWSASCETSPRFAGAVHHRPASLTLSRSLLYWVAL